MYGAADTAVFEPNFKPLLDRIDICAEAVPMKYEELKDKGWRNPPVPSGRGSRQQG